MDWLSTLPHWALSAILAGVVAAVGVLVGAIFERRGHKWGRRVAIIFIIGGFAVAREDWSDRIVRSQTSDAQVESQLLSRFPEGYSAIKADFPGDYQALIAGFGKAYRADPENAAQSFGGGVAALRKKYSPYLAKADHASLLNLLTAYVSVHRLILNSAGEKACALFAEEGPSGVGDLLEQQSFAVPLSHQMATLFDAEAAGLRSPILRPDPTDADWQEVMTAMVAAGAPASYLQTIAKSDVNDPDLCLSLIALFQALGADNTSSGDLVLAYFLSKIAAA